MTLYAFLRNSQGKWYTFLNNVPLSLLEFFGMESSQDMEVSLLFISVQ